MVGVLFYCDLCDPAVWGVTKKLVRGKIIHDDFEGVDNLLMSMRISCRNHCGLFVVTWLPC